MSNDERNLMLLNDKTLNIVRLGFLYGDYTQKRFMEYYGSGYSKQSFSRYMNFLLEIYGDRIEKKKAKGVRAPSYSFKPNGFEEPDNIIMHLFKYANISDFDMALFIRILQLLENNNESSIDIEIFKNTFHKYTFYLNGSKDDDTFDDRTFERHFDQLSVYGYIEQNKDTIKILAQPTYVLDDDELLMLTALVDLCRNILPLGISAYYLFETLGFQNAKRGLNHNSVFEFKHLHMCQAADDPVMWKIIAAIYEKRIISFEYAGRKNLSKSLNETKKECTLQPTKIIINENDGRRYVFGNSWNDDPRLFRLDRIMSEINIKNPPEGFHVLTEEEAQKQYTEEMKLSISGSAKSNNNNFTGSIRFRQRVKRVKYDILRMFPDTVLKKIAPDEFEISFSINTGNEIKPFLFRYASEVRLVSCSDSDFVKKLEEEMREWRNMYDIQ